MDDFISLTQVRVVEGSVECGRVGGEDCLVSLHHQVPAPHLHIRDVAHVNNILEDKELSLKTAMLMRRSTHVDA